MQRQFSETLIRQTPDRRNVGGKEWLQANPYVRRHLANHAAAAGMLGELTDDPLYLATAEPHRLLAAMDISGDPVNADTAYVYQVASHNLLTASFAERASYLEMAARQRGLNVLADRFAQLPLPLRFSVPWARWGSSAPHRQDSVRTASKVSALALGKRGRPRRGSSPVPFPICMVRVYDLESGAATGEPIRSDDIYHGVNALAVADRSGRAVIVSGGYRSPRVWDMESGVAVGEPMQGDHGSIMALAVGERAGRAVIVSGGYEGLVWVWDLESGVAVGEPLGHSRQIRALAMGERAGRAVIVSGSEYSDVRVWDLELGVEVSTLPRPYLPHYEIVAGGGYGDVGVWDLESGVEVGRDCSRLYPKQNHYEIRALAVGKWAGSARCSSPGGRIRRREGVGPGISGVEVGEPLKGHQGDVSALAVGDRSGRGGHRIRRIRRASAGVGPGVGRGGGQAAAGPQRSSYGTGFG